MIKPEREKHRFTRKERSRSSDACLYWKKKLLTSSRIEEKTEIQNGGYERHGNFFLLLPKLYTFDVKWEIVSIAQFSQINSFLCTWNSIQKCMFKMAKIPFQFYKTEILNGFRMILLHDVRNNHTHGKYQPRMPV